ncbi:hypothetical protein Tco_0427847 [Tanacetum coccineum]
MFIEFVIQNQFFSYSLEEFAQILNIPCKGACVFTDKWSLDELAYGVPTDGPYLTNPPFPDDIISSIRFDREGQVRRIRHEEEIDVLEYQVLTREIEPTLKPLEETIWENFDLAYFMAKQIEWATRQKRLILPHGMLLTHLFNVIMNENPELNNVLNDCTNCVMNPLAAQQERKPRKDCGTRRGRHSTSSSSAFDQPSSSHLNDDDDDDDGNGEGTSCASTPSPICYVNSLTNQSSSPLLSSSSQHSTMNSTNASSSNPSKKIKLTIIPPRQLFVNISSDKDITTTPSPTTTSSSPTPPNAPSKTTSTNQTSSSQENTSSSFHSKLQISPPSSHEPTSPHNLNPLLDNILDVPHGEKTSKPSTDFKVILLGISPLSLSPIT